MKKVMIFLILMMNVLCAKAQFVNNVKLGGSIIYSNQLKEKAFSNIGVDLRTIIDVHEFISIRGIGNVNGFIPNGFDRYGTIMCGVQTNGLPVYLFSDFGMNYNASGKSSIGMAFDCGIGLNIHLKNHWSLYSELCIDRINSAKYWQSTPQVKLGVLYSL